MKRTKRSSTLQHAAAVNLSAAFARGRHGGRDAPFFGHHKDALYQQPLEDLWSYALEQAEWTLVLDNELHHLDETLEGLAQACRGRLGLQANLGHNERLGHDGGQSLGHGAEGLGPWRQDR